MGCLQLATALALAASATPPVAPPASSAVPTETEVIALDLERYERLTVPVTIGESGPYRFLVDTGAQATVLSRELADTLGLVERRSATLIGIASIAITQTVALDDVGLGQQQAHIATVPLVERRHIGADGVLGLDVLQGRRVLLDFAARRMEVVSAAKAPRASDYEIVVRARSRLGRLIIADALVDGVRTAVVIDTGASASIGNPALARRLRSKVEGTAQLADINGNSTQGQLQMVDELRIERLSLAKLPVLFTPSPAFDALGLSERPAMILGMRELRLFRRVAIDFDRRRIYFDVPSTIREFDAGLAFRTP